MQRSLFCLPFAVATMLFSSGCTESGPQRYLITGKVSMDGTPVERGDILFMPTEPGPSVDGGKINNGAYSVEVKPGTKRVVIRAVRNHPTKMMPGIEPGTMEPVQEEYIPAKYNRATELEANVQQDEMLDFHLSS